MLNIGDKVYLPKYGAGIVTSINEKETIDKGLIIYISIFLFIDKMDLLLPSSKIESYKLRKIAENDKLEEALSIIEEVPKDIVKVWGKRYRINNEKIASGDLQEECEVLRDLYYLKKKGLLPPGEHKILERAENMVASEVMLVYDISLEEALERIKIFSK